MPINELTAAATMDGSELFHAVQLNNSRKVAGGVVIDDLKWFTRAIGEPFPIWDHIAGAQTPPTDNSLFRFIKLTASDSYNTGVLTRESVAGSAPLVFATAMIDEAASPMDGQVVTLINTEMRVLRAGGAGTLQDDALQGHLHSGVYGPSAGNAATGGSATQYTVPPSPSDNKGSPVSDGSNGTPRVANETRTKNIGVTYYMRIR